MPTNSPSLIGKRVLVVQDDFLLANRICHDLRDLGATILGPASTHDHALQLMARKHLDAAILDLQLQGNGAFQLADILLASKVPMIFATASGQPTIPWRFRDIPRLEKPIEIQALADIVGPLMRDTTPSQPQSGSALTDAPVVRFARVLSTTLGKVSAA